VRGCAAGSGCAARKMTRAERPATVFSHPRTRSRDEGVAAPTCSPAARAPSGQGSAPLQSPRALARGPVHFGFFSGFCGLPGGESRWGGRRAAPLGGVAFASSVWRTSRGCRAAADRDSPSALPARLCLFPPAQLLGRAYGAGPNPQRGRSAAGIALRARAPAPRIGRVDPGDRSPLGRSTPSTGVPATHGTCEVPHFGGISDSSSWCAVGRSPSCDQGRVTRRPFARGAASPRRPSSWGCVCRRRRGGPRRRRRRRGGVGGWGRSCAWRRRGGGRGR